MNSTLLTVDHKEEFRLVILEIIREFVKQPDAELQIDMRNDDTLYLHSKENSEFDLNPAYLKIKTIVQRTHFKKTKGKKGYPSTPDTEYVPTEKIQLIRLDDIVSISYFNELEESEDE